LLRFQEFGDIRFCALVRDKSTNMPKGTAFVQFRKPEGAESILAHAQEYARATSRASAAAGVAEGRVRTSGSGIFLHGRELLISRAVDRSSAAALNTRKQREPQDKRNLYLAYEGCT
jgi:nucleolar protein 4